MTNEPLGIYEELREKAERYAAKGEAMRRRIMGAGPADNGAYAETSNPFSCRLRLKNGGRPFHATRPPGSSSMRRRPIFPEAELGLNIVQVVQAVMLESGMTVSDLMTSGRTRKFSWPRQVAMWVIDRYCPEYSLPEVGYVFRKDHTTVMHAIEVVEERLQHNCTKTKTLVANVRQRLGHIANGGD